MDYDVKRFTRRCSVTQRDLLPGEGYFSVLRSQGAEVVRQDYSREAWQEVGPPVDALGWWRSVVPTPDVVRQHWAPQDVMLHLFEELGEQPENADLRYVLALLMVRRRVLRVAQVEKVDGIDFWVVTSPKFTQEERVEVREPAPARRAFIEAYLKQFILERVA